MFSSDNNINRIAELVEEIKHWFTTKAEYTKYDIIDKVVRILSRLIVSLITSLLILIVLIYLSFAAAYALSDAIGSLWLAFTCVGAFYMLLLALFFFKRKAWVERPLVKFLVKIIFDDNE